MDNIAHWSCGRLVASTTREKGLCISIRHREMLIGNVNMIEQVRCFERILGKILIYPYREEIRNLSH